MAALIIVIILKSLVLLMAILILTWFMRRSSAAIRHLYLSAAVMVLLALPLVSLMVPSWDLEWFSHPFAPGDGKTIVTTAESVETPMESDTGKAQFQSPSSGKSSQFHWFDWILAVWLVGALGLLLRLVGGKLLGYWVITAMAEGTDFKNRILSILNPTARRRSPQRMHWRAVIVLALLFLLPFGAFSPWAAADRPPGASSPSLAALDPGDRDENKKSGETTAKESKESSQNTGDQNKTRLFLFLELLKSPSASVRMKAASALRDLGDRRAVPALIEMLKDEDAVVREHVATALGRLGDKRAVQPLNQALQKEQDYNVQVHIISALKKLR